MPPAHSHEEFIELCALSTSGSLTPEEAAHLCEHLLHCPSCRELKREYESVIKHALPVLAAASSEQISSAWSLEQAEISLMTRLDAEIPSSASISSISSRRSERKHIGVYLLAALVLLGCGAVLHMILQGRLRHSSKAPSPIEVSTIKPAPVEQGIVHLAPSQEDTKALDEIARLRARLRARTKDIDQLNAEKSQLQTDLTTRTGDLANSSQRLSALEQQLASAHSEEAALQDKLTLAEKQGSENSSQIAALQSEIANLHIAIQQGDRELAEDDGLLAHDRDIRDLMGARNLYIAEIYDVAKTGATQKPFGRVFYTKDKSLIFYGYDLDQQPGLKDANTFQAWGRSGSSEHDVSLGLFYQDDASKKRWILKCNDARSLAQLDAVFVTVEPKGGSAKPTGKPLLFTYLRLEPNHP